MIAENLLFKQQLIVLRRARRRAPNLTRSDRLLCRFWSLFLSVSNLLSGGDWELDEVPAVGDPTHIAQIAAGDSVAAGKGHRCVVSQ